MRMESLAKKFALVLTLVLAVALLAAPAVAAEEKPAAAPSLYDRLGGANSIAIVVDDIIETAYSNKILNANPKIAEGHKRFPKAAYKFKVTLLACQVTGGPFQYVGRTMKEAHQHLDITEAEWKELIATIRGSLDKYKVPQKEQDELVAVIENTKMEIVAPALKSPTVMK
jgi:hemoglobin